MYLCYHYSTLQPQTVLRMRVAMFQSFSFFFYKTGGVLILPTRYSLPTLSLMLHFLPFASNVLGRRNLKNPASCSASRKIIKLMKLVQEILVHWQLRGSLSAWLSHYLKNTLENYFFLFCKAVGYVFHMKQQWQ